MVIALPMPLPPIIIIIIIIIIRRRNFISTQQRVWKSKRDFALVPASVCGIATLQCSSSTRHLRSPGRSGPIAIPALFLTLWNYTPKGIKNKI